MAIQKTPDAPAKPPKQKFTWKLLPDIWALIEPRRGGPRPGFCFDGDNRVSGLILRHHEILVDNVFLKHPVQSTDAYRRGCPRGHGSAGLTSSLLLNLLSKSAQKMIAELRGKVQAHIGRLPCRFTTRTRQAPWFRDHDYVEGVRNLIGTGLVELAGGLMTALIALGYLLHTSVTMTVVAFAVLLVFGLGLNKAFTTIRPIFRARSKITAEVSGRLTESTRRRCASLRVITPKLAKKKYSLAVCRGCSINVAENADRDVAHGPLRGGADGPSSARL